MSVGVGFTDDEIRELVAEYYRQRHGSKGVWLAARGLTRRRMERWSAAVFEGDLDRGLVPRKGALVTVPPGKRAAFERQRAAEQAAHEAEIARLSARIRELEATNDALGKAIGLLHERNGQEPDGTSMTADRPDS
ncbi:hypothetical protein [Agromyces bracchium]|uniref:Uncharacterized protein n=1 Tax=Agromyces bracchium TaxID=88376 RepID=A0A6I3M9D3_9MICO|nr:hypothetical protein [Agromyces bracchium]